MITFFKIFYCQNVYQNFKIIINFKYFKIKFIIIIIYIIYKLLYIKIIYKLLYIIYKIYYYINLLLLLFIIKFI